MDNEKEIEQLTDFLVENGIFNNLVCRQDYANPDALIYECCRQVAELVINLGYRKADIVRKSCTDADCSKVSLNLDNVEQVVLNKDGIKIVAPLEGIDLSSIGAIEVNGYKWTNDVQDVQTEVAKVLQEIVDCFDSNRVISMSFFANIARRYGIDVIDKSKITGDDKNA